MTWQFAAVRPGLKDYNEEEIAIDQESTSLLPSYRPLCVILFTVNVYLFVTSYFPMLVPVNVGFSVLIF